MLQSRTVWKKKQNIQYEIDLLTKFKSLYDDIADDRTNKSLIADIIELRIVEN